MRLRSKINESHFLVALMGGYFGMLYNNFAPIRGVVVFYLRNIPDPLSITQLTDMTAIDTQDYACPMCQ